MNPSGIVIIIAGVWVATQVLKGNALQRLGILPADQSADDGKDGGKKIPLPLLPDIPVPDLPGLGGLPNPLRPGGGDKKDDGETDDKPKDDGRPWFVPPIR